VGHLLQPAPIAHLQRPTLPEPRLVRAFADRLPIDDILPQLDAALVAAPNLVLLAPLTWPFAPGVRVVGAGSAFFMA
jgi:hypothetical protein